MNYDQKLLIANRYLLSFGFDWDDLCDVNSLHDCDDERSIIEACIYRLKESGFPDVLSE
jgi:hypothetical protein